MKKPIHVIIVGAGHRSMIYASHADTHPEEMQIVGVADPDPVRRTMVQEKYHFGDEMCFENAEELAQKGKLADAVINGTMDQQHVQTTVLLLRAGYDVLLEKPFAVNEEEMRFLVNTAKECKRKVMICHVLRYTPFYRAVKKAIMEGEIGEIINIQMTEHVSYHHMAVSYVRGKWGSEKICGAPMLLAKSCHDMDLMMWMMEGVKPVELSSFGSDFLFKKDKKPNHAGKKCLVDCPIEKDCIYSAKQNYLKPPYRWGFYVWESLEGMEVNDEIKENSLKEDNPYGRCVWECERDGNVDHQSVLIHFENGATGTFNMIGNASRPERNIHIIGTKGEIKGIFDDSSLVIRKPCPQEPNGYTEIEISLKNFEDMTGMNGGHGGGDELVSGDFVKYICDKEVSISCTALDVSVLGHLAVFRAEKARKENRIVSMDL